MKRIHVSLQVKNLENSVRFYSALFGTEPTFTKPDYAKWMLEDPRINFSIGEGVENPGIKHLGIQAETPEELAELRQRIGHAGGTVENEGETTCCYHNSDKTWVVDAQGVSWEAFYTSGEAETYYAPEGQDRSDGCCATECCQEDAVPIALPAASSGP